MSVRVIFELNFRPELVERVKEGFRDQLGDTRAFDGCEEITILANQDEPTKLVVLEQWKSREHYDAYLKWRTDRGDLEGMTKACTEPYKLSFYDYVPV
jgi:quinol monooxygenase YgiN